MAQANPLRTPAQSPTDYPAHDALDIQNNIDRQLLQLDALLCNCYGGGAQWLADMSEAHRDGILWLASDLASNIRTNFKQLREVSHG